MSSISFLQYILPAAVVYLLLGAPGLEDYLRDATVQRSQSLEGLRVNTDMLIRPDSGVSCPEHKFKTFVFSSNPLVIYFEDFVSENEIEAIIDYATPKLYPAILGSDQANSTDPNVRNSTIAGIQVDHPLSTCLARRALAFQGWPAESYVEQVAAQRYLAPYGHYSHHYDWGGSTERSGGRRSSFMVYLSTPGKGGGTNFPRLPRPQEESEAGGDWCRFIECGDEADKWDGTTFKAIKGNAVWWINLKETGEVIEETWHAGLPVDEGEKWGLNIWTWWTPGWKLGMPNPMARKDEGEKAI